MHCAGWATTSSGSSRTTPRAPSGTGPTAWSSSSASGSSRGSDLEIDWELEPAGPDAALATINMRGRGRSSGAPAEMHFFQLWSFRDGRAVRMEMFHDLDEARRAAGLA